MRRFYFVGGPTEGHLREFLELLAGVGGTPEGWEVFPHLEPDGRALHLVQAASEDEILAHLAHFDPIYERGTIVEVVDRR